MGDDERQPNGKLRRARELRGWSQRYVAGQIGTTEHVVSRWESGQHKPNRYFQTELCKLFGKNAEELGFMPAYAQEEMFRYTKGADFLPPPRQSSNRELLKEMIDRNFPQDVTYNLLSANIKTMNFRDEWQYVVNDLVAETRIGLRAMVFDVELTRWWNSIAGQIYMMTNLNLLKKRVSIKRIFLLSSLDVRLRMNALMNAYVHRKMGIEVKVCTATGFQNSIPFTPDMFSVHDNLFVTLYYFSPAKPLTNLLLEEKYITEFCSFYDELFLDDRLCTDVESVLAHARCGESFWASAKMQLKLLQRLEKIESTVELAKNTWT